MSAQLPQVLKKLDDTKDEALERLFELIRIPSISTDPAYKAQCEQAAEWCVRQLGDIGFEARLVRTTGHPMVVGHAGGARRTGGPHVLFYGHYDVQPVGPARAVDIAAVRADASSPTTLNGQVIVARGAEDNKGQLMTFFEAARAWKSVAGACPIAITVLLEGEEEMRLAVAARVPRRARQGGDGRPGARVRHGPMGQGHAGHLHAAQGHRRHRDRRHRPEPGPALGQLRWRGHEPHSRAREDHGRDARRGRQGAHSRFYDDIKTPSPAQLAQWQGLGFDARKFLAEVGLSEPAGERGYSVLEQIWARPTVEFNGITGGYQGVGSKTVIPSQASVKITCRLVPGQDPQKVLNGIERFVKERLPKDCRAEFPYARGTEAMAFDTEASHIRQAAQALEEEWGRPAALIGMGGSIPIVTAFKETLGMDSLLVGFGLDDDRIHSPNEKYNLSSFHKGARSWARILDKLAA